MYQIVVDTLVNPPQEDEPSYELFEQVTPSIVSQFIISLQ
jgi:hypothetical protein